MPSINVRLTEEQHTELRKVVYARGRQWSMQKEIIERLFPPLGGLSAGERGLGEPSAPALPRRGAGESAGAAPAERPFKGPDPRSPK